MNTLGIKLYFSENDDDDDDDDDDDYYYYCQTEKTLNITNIPEMILYCQKKQIRCEKLVHTQLN